MSEGETIDRPAAGGPPRSPATATAAPARPDAAPAGRGPTRLGGVRRAARASFDLAVVAFVAVAALSPGLLSLAESDSERAATSAARALLAAGDPMAVFGLIDGRLSPLLPLLQAAVAKASGFGADVPIALLRTPSAVAAALALGLTYALGRMLGGAAAGLSAALLLAATPLFAIVGRTAVADALVMAATLAALLPLAAAYRDPGAGSRPWALLFWAALAVGIHAGGAFVPVVVVLTLVVVVLATRSLAVPSALHPLWGLTGLAVVVGGPLAALAFAGDGAILADYGRSLAERLAGDGSARALPGVYGLMAVAAFWPAVALLPVAVAHLMIRPVGDGSRFLLAALLPAWALIEVFAIKRSADMAPLLPLLALLVGMTVAEGGLVRTTGWRRAVLGWIALGGLAAVIGLNAAFVATAGRADALGVVGAVAVGALAIAAWRILVTGRTWPGLVATAATGLLAGALAFGLLLPQDPDLWGRIEALAFGRGTGPIAATPPAAETGAEPF